MTRGLLATLTLLCCACTPPSPPAPAAPATQEPGTGFARLRMEVTPAAGEAIPAFRATLERDGRGTLDTGAGAAKLTVGPIQMTELEERLAAARGAGNQTHGLAACGKQCRHAIVVVTPVRGAAWTLELHGPEAPAEAVAVVELLLHALRPTG